MKRAQPSPSSASSVNNKFSMIQKSRAAVIGQQNKLIPKKGEMTLDVNFAAYVLNRKVDGKNTQLRTTEPPEFSTISKRDNPAIKFPKPLDFYARIENIVGNVDALPDNGGWKVVVSNITISEEARDWIRANAPLYYAGNGEYQGPTFHFPDYIGADGLWRESFVMTIQPRKEYKCSSKDSNPGENGETVIFRQKKSRGKGGYVVGPSTKVRLTSCQVEVYVGLKTSDEGVQAPSTYITVRSKGAAELIPGQDLDAPLSTRLHAMESKDGHHMVAIEKLMASHSNNVVPHSVYSYLTDNYTSPYPAEQGICSALMPALEVRDFMMETKDGMKTTVTLRQGVWQWHGTPDDPNSELYNVKYVTVKSKGDLWKSYGITDELTYAHVMTNNPIFAHVEAEYWDRSTREAEPNKLLLRGNFTEEDLAEDPALPYTKGYYTYCLNNIVPDYVAYLSKYGVPVSWDWVETIFADDIAIKGNKKKALHLVPPHPTERNPLHDENTNPVVFSLGNGDVHGYSGDFLKDREMDDYAFFIVTNHPLMGSEHDEDRTRYCGTEALERLDDTDAWVERLRKEEEGFRFWIMAVKKEALNAERTRAEKAKRAKSLSLPALQARTEEGDEASDMDDEE